MKMITKVLPLLWIGALAAAESAPQPFTLPIPAGWRTETIPFPLSFAPDLEYAGVEELRFAPGMFEPEREDFWSYAFVWWLEGEHELDDQRLGRDLSVYFRGLVGAVLESKEQDPPDLGYKANLTPGTADGKGGATLEGTVETHDAFVTGKNLVLNVKVMPLASLNGVTVFFFALSPQPFDHGIWKELEAIREGFRHRSADPDVTSER